MKKIFILLNFIMIIVLINLTSVYAETSSLLFSTNKDDNLLSRAGMTSTAYNVIFVDLNNYDTSGINTIDYSDAGDESVLAWRSGNTLYIGGYGKIIAGKSLSYAFYMGKSIKSIEGLDLLDTSNVIDMSYMFAYNYDFIPDLGDDFNTSSVTNMSRMFSFCGYEEGDSLVLGKGFDTSNVRNMSYMFECCGCASKNFLFDIGDNFNTLNVTNMSGMFWQFANSSTTFSLDLGDEFDTSKVTNMSEMFYSCGVSSASSELKLGKKFQTANVNNMSKMFYECGFPVLDLSNFTVKPTTDLTQFAAYAKKTKKFIFGEGWENATMPSTGKTKGFAFVTTSTETLLINAPDSIKNYLWTSDYRNVNYEYQFTDVWFYETDSGFYMSDNKKLGVVRFLFNVGFDGDITEFIEVSGIKYIKVGNIAENVGESVFSGSSNTGTATTFFGDIVNITEDRKDDRYYAVGYIIADGKTYWSKPVEGIPNFEKRVNY